MDGQKGVQMSVELSAAQSLKAKAQAHQKYYLKDGTLVPGTTTITGLLDKPALKYWANKIGLQGIEIAKYTDALANVGTAAHAAVIADLSGRKADDELADLAPDVRALAENCYLSFCAWAKGHTVEPIIMETPLVSEHFRYGGKADFAGLIDGELEVVEFKTGGIWPEHFTQLAAYGQLLRENGIIDKPVSRYRVLSIPRAATETFDEKVKGDVAVEWLIFQHLLAVYWLKKEA